MPKPKTQSKPKKTPPAKKTQTRKWAAFVLSDNTVTAINGVKKAKVYEDDNAEMVKEKRTFVLKSEMVEWVSVREMQFKSLPVKPKPGQRPVAGAEKVIDLDDQAKIDAALREIDAKRPSDKLEIHYRTSSESRAVPVVLRFINLQGKDAWNLKPDSICLSISNFVQVFKQECPVVAVALSCLEHMRMRDPSGDMNAIAQKKWTSPLSKEERSFDTFVATTHFILPSLEELPTQQDETAYIEAKCKEMGEAILYIIQQDTFAKCYEHAIKHDRIWRAVSGQTSKAPGNSYVDYVKGARVVVMHCPSFNSHVVKDDAAVLCEILRNNSYGTAKYPLPEGALDDTDEEDEEEEEEEPDVVGEGLTTPKKNEATDDTGAGLEENLVTPTTPMATPTETPTGEKKGEMLHNESSEKGDDKNGEDIDNQDESSDEE